MVISTSLTNRINNVINVELDLMKQKLIDLDFEDDYINDLAKEVISPSKQGKLLRSTLTLLIGQMTEEMDENIRMNIVNVSVAIELLHTASLVHDDIVDISANDVIVWLFDLFILIFGWITSSVFLGF